MNFESSNSQKVGKPIEVSSDAGAVFREEDDAVVSEFHPLSSGDFSDSTRDLLQGMEVRERGELNPKASEILRDQESLYTQLQTDITGIQYTLESEVLSPEKRTELTQKLSQLQERARKIAKFLQLANKYVGPLQ